MEIRLVDAKTGRKLGEAKRNEALVVGDLHVIGGVTYRIKRVDAFDETVGATVVWLVREGA